MTTTTEVLVDAIAYFHRAHEPESLAYRLHNPLLLRSFARAGKHEIDEQGRRVFHSSLAGYKAAIDHAYAVFRETLEKESKSVKPR